MLQLGIEVYMNITICKCRQQQW